MKRLSYVDFWGKMFIFYLFFVDVHNWHGAPKNIPVPLLHPVYSHCRIFPISMIFKILASTSSIVPYLRATLELWACVLVAYLAFQSTLCMPTHLCLG